MKSACGHKSPVMSLKWSKPFLIVFLIDFHQRNKNDDKWSIPEFGSAEQEFLFWEIFSIIG